jgi:hypothetical protein
VFEGTGWHTSSTCSQGIIGTSPAGAERGYVKRRTRKKPKQRNTEKLTLAPIKFDDALRALLKTQPPPSSKKAKKL